MTVIVEENIKELFELQILENEENSKYDISAVISTIGPRETSDGRRFWYTKEAFSEYLNGQHKIPMKFNHNLFNDKLPYGYWGEFEVKDNKVIGHGNFYNTTEAKDVRNILKDSNNVLGGVSVAISIIGAEMVDINGNPVDEEINTTSEENYLKVTSLTLNEISIVEHPANTDAKIINIEQVTDMNGKINPRLLEKLLREECSLTNSQAVSATGVFTKISKIQSESRVTDENNNSRDTGGNSVIDNLNNLLLNNKLNNLANKGKPNAR